MCGRFTLRMPVKELAPLFEVASDFETVPRYNIAPTQSVLAVRQGGDGKRQIVGLRWGLVPAWADDPSIGNRAFNARSETAAEKPMFRSAIKTRRCAILADGFYEWKREGNSKLPLLFEMTHGEPFAIGGLWERWNREGAGMETCTLLTTAANELMATIHDRMPVVVPRAALAAWLNPEPLSKAKLEEFFVPFPSEGMRSTAVNPIVNNARNEDPRCVAPYAVG